MKNLIELRKNAHKTQLQMSTVAGVSPQVYSHYETGRVIPPLESLAKLADFFHCSIDYLVGREGEEGVVVISENSLSTEEKELLDGYRQLNFAARGKIQGYMQGLLSAPYITTFKKV